MNSCHEEGV
eukprot:gene27255-biopygen17781